MTEGNIQGEWFWVRNNGEFEITEFGVQLYYYKLIAILRRQYHIIGENIFRIGRSREATEPNTEYIFSQRRQYNVVLPSQNRN